MDPTFILFKALSILLAWSILSGELTVAREMLGPVPRFEYTAQSDQDRTGLGVSPRNIQSASQNTDELVVDRYPNGKIKVKRQVTLNENNDFVNNGLYSAFDSEGRHLGAGNYALGVRTGQWDRIFRQREGNVFAESADRGFIAPFRSIATFENGNLDGDWTISDSKGLLLSQWHFVDGRRQGAWIWFNPDGTIRKQVTYENGHVAADIVASDGTKQLKVVTRYLDGRALVPVLTWHGPNRKKSEGQVLRPREITVVNVDWWNGAVETKVVNKEGQEDRHGQSQFWHANGKLEMQGTYEVGKRVGTFTWWHASGQKKAEGQYVNGLAEGPWQTWYPSGMRESYGRYVAGKREGAWFSWHENGMRKFDGQYANGVLAENARTWSAEGKQVRPTTTTSASARAS